ncbi:MAG: hypothetical protein ABI723_11040 [Bacteroidia bacterium]
MQTINRDLLYILPKQPLVDWINDLDPKNPLTLDDVTGHDTADIYLIPEFENDEMALAWLENDWEMWFDRMLSDWWTEEEDWPQNRSWEMLNEFFDISYQSMIYDTQPYTIIKEDIGLEDDDEEFEEGQEEEHQEER